MTETYTHGHHESVLRSHRRRTAANSAAYLLDRLSPGCDLVDVGCGPGTITVDLARRLAPGRVVGVDRSAEVVETARRDAGDVPNLEFRTADAHALPFEDASVDAVHAHQLLQHLADPVAALREMRRVCRPGGVVAARDSDYASMSWSPADPELDRWLDLYRRAARANGGEPDAARYLLGWARRAGFSAVVPSASAWCFATPDDRAWWGGMWADRITDSALARQLVDERMATTAELEEISAAWRRWVAAPDGWFAILHGEVLCTP
jgi:ubiquinone/menaquinone biosynthesis C-methylase UbiE